METYKGSRRCGLATSLMKFCFEDPSIGIANPRIVDPDNPANKLSNKPYAEKSS